MKEYLCNLKQLLIFPEQMLAKVVNILGFAGYSVSSDTSQP
jgi:hypothetical protein